MAPTRTQLEKSLVGPAGEHFVMYQLCRRGWLAGFPPPGSPWVDVLVMTPDERIVAAIQVKTRTGRNKGWPMGAKHETYRAAHGLYTLVDLEPEVPVTYIVPAIVVADTLVTSHRTWLAQNPARRDNPVRQILPKYSFPVRGYPPGWLDQYRERWDLVEKAIQS